MFICDCGNNDFEKTIHEGLYVYMCTNCECCYNEEYLEEIIEDKKIEMPDYFKWKSTR